MCKQQEPAEGNDDEKGVDWRKVRTHLGVHSNRVPTRRIQLHRPAGILFELVPNAKRRRLSPAPFLLNEESYSFTGAPFSFSRCSLSTARRLSLILLPSSARHLTRIWSPSFNSSRTSLMRFSAISLKCSRPSVPGKISTKAPKSTSRTTLPR